MPNSISVLQETGNSFIQIDNEFATCKISLFGGHVLSFIPKHDNQERLYVSPTAKLDGSKAIRGGIPVCWPWFSDDHGRDKGTLPAHGFLRTQNWHIESQDETLEYTRVTLVPGFTHGAGFDHDVSVKLIVTVSSRLDLELHTTNKETIPVTYNGALHTYFAVNDLATLSLTGLSGNYRDKLQDMLECETPSEYRIAGEVDRIHLVPAQSVMLNDRHSTRIAMQGHDSVVVWNPYHKAEQMGDMPDDDWLNMVCVEVAVTKGQVVAPNETHVLIQTIE